MDAETVNRRFWTPQRRRLYAAYVLLAVLILTLSSIAAWQRQHGFVINVTDSLPNWAFWIDRTRPPVRGDYVFFRVPATPLITAHFGERPRLFGKRIYGMPGDVVTLEGRTFFVNGQPVATAKPISQKGLPLALGPTGVIPPNHYFVATPHKDGFDSRYADIGWVSARQLAGVGTPVL